MKQLKKLIQNILPVLFSHAIILHIYIGTINYHYHHNNNDNNNGPVFDESEIYITNQDTRYYCSHITTTTTNPNHNNCNVNTFSILSHLIRHDYWGQDIFHFNSNKSWRPFTVLTFRWLNQFMGDDNDDNKNMTRLENEVRYNRYINVMLHMCVTEMVSVVGTLLFPITSINTNTNTIPMDDYYQPYASVVFYQVLTRLIFAMHPVAIEVVANGANRPHVIGLCCSLIAVLIITATATAVRKYDSGKTTRSSGIVTGSIIALYIVWMIGLCSSETIVFHVPAIFVTCVAIQWQRLHQEQLVNHKNNHREKKGVIIGNQMMFVKQSLRIHLPYFATVLGMTMAYLCGRFMLGINAINRGILRKSQTPFHFLDGRLSRMVNFSHITCIHILKACFLDPIGKSYTKE